MNQNQIHRLVLETHNKVQLGFNRNVKCNRETIIEDTVVVVLVIIRKKEKRQRILELNISKGQEEIGAKGIVP